MKQTSAIQRIEKKKKDNIKLLQSLSNIKTKNQTAGIVYSIIGNKLGVTGQTVVNYISGNAKDGYLLDAMIEEFKELK